MHTNIICLKYSCMNRIHQALHQKFLRDSSEYFKKVSKKSFFDPCKKLFKDCLRYFRYYISPFLQKLLQRFLVDFPAGIFQEIFGRTPES